MTQWIDFLKQELETSQNEQIKLNIVTALGTFLLLFCLPIYFPIAFTLSENSNYLRESFVFKSLLTTPNNVLPLHLKQTFLPMI